jgi:iron complex transport system substrate-binding protein
MIKNHVTRLFKASLIVLLAVAGALLSASADARMITDMAGRKVQVPDRITRVFATSPPATYLLYAMNPSLIVGLNNTVNAVEKRFLNPAFLSLPVIGSSVGQGKSMNSEMLLKIKPDIVLVWSWQQPEINEKFEQIFRQLKIPTVYLKIDTLRDYPAAFTFMGDLLNHQERGAELRRYAEETLQSVERAVGGIAREQRPTIYYAEGVDGLATEREGAVHAELIGLAGGRNVHRGEALDHYGMEKVSLEQVILYNPQVILVQEREFMDSVYRDSRWKGIRALKEKWVYKIPRLPFNWFDRPPSFMRLLGLRWLTNRLHPGRFPFDATAETKRFYRLFLRMEPSNKDMQDILQGS